METSQEHLINKIEALQAIIAGNDGEMARLREDVAYLEELVKTRVRRRPKLPRLPNFAE